MRIRVMRRRTTSPRTRPRDHEVIPWMEEQYGPPDKVIAGRKTWTF